LADRFGFAWENIKNTPSHIIQKYINDIGRSKNNFGGMNSMTIRNFGQAMQEAGIPLN